MTISQAIKQLEDLRERVGDVEVVADCPHCRQSFHCDTVAVGPVLVRLTQELPAARVAPR